MIAVRAQWTRLVQYFIGAKGVEKPPKAYKIVKITIISIIFEQPVL